MKVDDSNSDSFIVYQKVDQLQTDSEEAKGHGILKLHNSVKAIQAKVEETYAFLTKEDEAIKGASAIVQKVAPIHVKDTEKITKLSTEVEELKAGLIARNSNIQTAGEIGALREAKDKLRAQVEDLTFRLLLEKRLKNDLEEAKGQEVLKLQKDLQVMQAKVDKTNALLESERNRANEALETSGIIQQKLEATVNKANQLQDLFNRLQDKFTHIESENKVLCQEVLVRAQSIENTKEYQDMLIRCISQDIGFSKGRPVAACIIYKCLRQWGSFEAERTDIFDRIISTIDEAIKPLYNNEVLPYWLSNASTLLLLMQHKLQKVESKYPASLFKKQLKACIEKMYRRVRDSLNAEIFYLLDSISKAQNLLNRTPVSQDTQHILIAHWKGIISNIDSLLNMLKSNHVPPFLVRKFFTHIFSFINAELFNSLLLRQECCTFSYGEYVKGLSELEYWCYKATERYAGSAWDELKHIRQAVGFLVIDKKPKMTLDEMRSDLCPILSIQQVCKISSLYCDDKFSTRSLSPNVISNMQTRITEDSSSSFLLKIDFSIPFSVDDFSKSTDQINIADFEPPPHISYNSGLMLQYDSWSFRFGFLLLLLTSVHYGSLIMKLVP